MLHMVGIEEKTSDDREIIAQLKEKFRTADRSEKVHIIKCPSTKLVYS